MQVVPHRLPINKITAPLIKGLVLLLLWLLLCSLQPKVIVDQQWPLLLLHLMLLPMRLMLNLLLLPVALLLFRLHPLCTVMRLL